MNITINIKQRNDKPVAGRAIYLTRQYGDPIVAEASMGLEYLYPPGMEHIGNFQEMIPFIKEIGEFNSVSFQLRIPKHYWDYVIAINSTIQDGHATERKIDWLVSPKGSMYFSEQDDHMTATDVTWGTILIGNNRVTVEGFEIIENVRPPNGKNARRVMARIAGFRKSDVGRPLSELLNEGKIHRCWCAYWKNGKNILGDTPVGVVYSPVWSPEDFSFVGRHKPKNLYVPADWLIKL